MSGSPDARAGRRLATVPPLPSAPRPVRPRAAAALAGPVVRAWPIVRGPAFVALGVTLLRLAGELLGWSPSWFSTLPGGGLALVGIAWLVPPTGAWCGYQLQRRGIPPPALARALGVPLAALALAPLLPWLFGRLRATTWTQHLTAWAVTSVLVTALTVAAWPLLGRLLLAYALAARVPVVLVMAVAIWRGLRTHYDAVPPGFPPMSLLGRWLWIGLLPQATIWVALTVALGAVAGVAGFLLAARVPR